MNTTTSIPQGISTNDSFPTIDIISRVESNERSLSTLVNNTTNSSYRKSYISWDRLERANKPENYTEKTKYLTTHCEF